MRALAQEAAPRTPAEMHRTHRDPKAYIAMLEGPARDAYQKPDEVSRARELKPGETIADIGSGSGYFTLRLAREHSFLPYQYFLVFAAAR